jgi:ABC-type antimicrobial peptide transport system permease subunit
LPKKAIPDSTHVRDAVVSLEQRLAAIPGITSTSLSVMPPPQFMLMTGEIEVEGSPSIAHDSLKNVHFNLVSPNYFRFAGIPLLEGRVFDANGSLSEDAPASEIMISRTLAKRLFPGGDAIGKRIRLFRNKPYVTVVGVVGTIVRPGYEKTPVQIYEPISAAPRYVSIAFRASTPIPLLERTIRQAARETVPLAKLRWLTNVDADLAEARAPQRYILSLVGSFAGLALLLAAIGLHAVVGYNVQQRWREIGIRIALGAPGARVAGLVIKQGMALALAGAALGIVGALYATRAMVDLLYETTPNDPLTLVVVAALLVAVAAIAACFPARRASRIDPVEMLRAD